MAEEKVADYGKNVIPLNLDDDEKHIVKQEIEEELAVIVREYEENGYYDKVEEARNEYDGVNEENIEFIYEDASRRKLLLSTIMSDIVSSKGKRQTLGPKPILLIEGEGNYRRKEKEIDDTLRRDSGIESIIPLIYRKGCSEGSCIVKVSYCYHADWHITKNIYTPQDLMKYEAEYQAQLMAGEQKYLGRWRKLLEGQEIEVITEDELVRFRGVKPTIVELDSFYARLSIKDFNDARLVGEQIDFQWKDIAARAERKYYDADAVEELKDKSGDDYHKKDYKFYEWIYLYRDKKTDKYYRTQITMDDTTKIILRAIYYPYNHGQVNYLNYCAIPRSDQWLGYSFYERTKDVVSAASSFLNSAINEINISHTPTILSDDSQFEAERKTVELGKINVLSFAKGSRFEPVKFNYAAMDRMQFINFMLTLTELTTGVSATLMSGRETPSDPRAPASKTAMKLAESNMRVEDIVLNFQNVDTMLIDQSTSIMEQYGLIEPIEDRDKIRFVIQGSRLSFDKEADTQMIMMIVEFLKMNYPGTWMNPDVQLALLSALLDNTLGSVEKIKDILLTPSKIAVGMNEVVQGIKKAQLQQGLASQMLAPGMTSAPGIDNAPVMPPPINGGPAQGAI